MHWMVCETPPRKDWEDKQTLLSSRDYFTTSCLDATKSRDTVDVSLQKQIKAKLKLQLLINHTV